VGLTLKALGLTIWGLIAFGLLVIFIFVGYEAALRYRATSGPPDTHRGPSGVIGAQLPANRTQAGQTTPSPPRTPDATRKLLLNAVQNRQYDTAIKYGLELVEGRSAGAADLSVVAQSYFSFGDCVNAQMFAQRAKEAFQAAGIEPDEALRQISVCCGFGRDKPRIALDSAQRARIDQLLDKTEAAKADSGGPFVRLGELYYGFGDYELAIASIQHGLNKGHIDHLDEAYVYLGLSEQAVGDLDEARNAFTKLNDVPGISPRVLRLWTLYAETQLSTTKSQSMASSLECLKNGASGPLLKRR
jgi:tetratricopeptide (TPR) repeat protein